MLFIYLHVDILYILYMFARVNIYIYLSIDVQIFIEQRYRIDLCIEARHNFSEGYKATNGIKPWFTRTQNNSSARVHFAVVACIFIRGTVTACGNTCYQFLVFSYFLLIARKKARCRNLR